MTGTTQAKRASWRWSFAAWSVAIAGAAAVAGCSGFGANANSYTCPAAVTVPDLQTWVMIVPGANGRHHPIPPGQYRDRDVRARGR